MFARGEMIVQWMEELAPKYLALPEDKIGLQVGTVSKPIPRVLVTLDVTQAVVQEAKQLGAELIITHHPLIYHPLFNLRNDTPSGSLLTSLIKHDIGVYVAHTNLDVAEDGMNDWLAQALQLTDCLVLTESFTDQLFKLVVFVPTTHLHQIRDALFRAGAGKIGHYSHCSFNNEGTGTFLPTKGAHPFVGERDQFTETAEIRIETIVPQNIRQKVVDALLKSHPYEEVAYDLYPIDLKGRTFGLGRVGNLSKAETLAEFAVRVKKGLNVPFVRVVGKAEQVVQKVAILGGSGAKYVPLAKRMEADVFVSGDLDFHSALNAQALGLALVDPGHHAEKIMKNKVAQWLEHQVSRGQYATEILISNINTEPFQFW